jgi:energy-coupling factor transporter ATP-binding protein EcfA2
MRIDWLKISNYRNLQNFEIDFDESQSTTVLLGHNGSGKSNLQEAIVEIFRELESGRPASFQYSIRYFCYGKNIEVKATPNSKKRLQISVDGKMITNTEFSKNKELLLPQYIFGYYSGWSSRLEQQFEAPTRKFRNQVLRNKDIPPRRFFFCRKDYSQLVLLAFFLTDSPEAKKLLREYLQIDTFETALFVIKKPARPLGGTSNLDAVDPRFWNTGGAFLPFLERLWNRSLAPIRNTEIIERDIRRRGEATERLYLFIKNQDQLSSLRQQYESTKLFFFNLESLFLCDLIDEVRIKVRKTDGRYVTFSQLSEGEQQLLTVLGLLIFTQDEESLFLLDEPNTHLNPVWTYDYLQLLKENLHSQQSQVIIATHDPLMIGSLYKNQVRIVSQEEGTAIAAEPEYDPKGIGIEGLLKSDLYGHKLRSSLPRDVLEDIDLQNQLVALPDRNAAQERQLEEVNQRLDKLAISRSHPNPLFALFAKAIANEPLFQKPELTKEDLEAQEQLANEIIDKILKDTPK